MDELIAFLRARLEDDEATARGTMWAGSNNVENWELTASATVYTVGDEFYAGDRYVANHIARHDPARVLREVEAKRRILSLHRCDDEGGPDPICNVCLYTPPCETLRTLALPYANHENYREEWRPKS